jgi:hypothetical protein
MSKRDAVLSRKEGNDGKSDAREGLYQQRRNDGDDKKKEDGKEQDVPRSASLKRMRRAQKEKKKTRIAPVNDLVRIEKHVPIINNHDTVQQQHGRFEIIEVQNPISHLKRA